MNSKISRRKFLAAAAALAAAPAIVPRSVFGANAPSNRINVAHIGTGKQGNTHVGWLSGGNYPDVRIVAICDVDKMSRDQAYARACRGYGSENPGITLHNEFEEVVSRPDVDAVLIAVPDHWHVLVALAAIRAGKDVYCEKPLTLTINETYLLTETARVYGTVFQTGSQQRSEDGHKFLHACQLVRNGYIGQVKEVWCSVGGPSGECDLPEEPIPDGLDWERWLGPAPWRPFNAVLRPPHNDSFPKWRDYRDFSGGGMTDWGAHHFDIAQWGLGYDGSGPSKIIPPDDKEVKKLTFIYDNGVKCYHGGHPDQPEGTGVYFIGTEGWVAVNRGMFETKPAGLRGLRLKPTDDQLYDSPGHHRDWLECIRSRRQPICDVAVGSSSVRMCHLGNIAYQIKRPLEFDHQARRFVNDEEANRLLGRACRAPWQLA